MFGKMALVAALVATPLAASAQYYSVPGYTIGGSGPGGFPGLYGGYPGAYPNTFQNQFLTLPMPQYGTAQPPQANTQTPTPRFYAPRGAQPEYPAATPAPAMRSTGPNRQPYQGQPQTPPRYIDEIPTNPQNRMTPDSAYGSPYAQPNYANGFSVAPPSPPRWAPQNGLPSFQGFAPRPSNNWSMTPFYQNGPVYAPQTAETPPRWPTQ